MKKFLAILLVLLVAGYVYWPSYTVGKLRDALRLADRETLEKRIDFPAVRAFMKAQLAVEKTKEPALKLGVIPPAKGIGRDMLAAAGLIREAMSAKLIDAMVTPEALTAILQSRRMRTTEDSDLNLSNPSWTGINTVTVVAGDKSRLYLKLSGVDGWRVVGLKAGEGMLSLAPQVGPGQ